MEESCASCGAREAEQLQKGHVNLKQSIELAGFVLFFSFFGFFALYRWHSEWDEGINARNKDLVCLSGRLLLFFPLRCRPLRKKRVALQT
jgi:hypothetical protein